MTYVIRDWIAQLQPDQVTEVFIVFILIIFVIALILRLCGWRYEFVKSVPALMSSIGILGTFLGIAIGLVSFDYASQQTIDESIPRLLGGMDTAFLTSITGIFFGSLFKIIDVFLYRDKHLKTQEIGAADIFSAIKEQTEKLNEMRCSIAGDGDATIITQLQKFRTEIHDDLKNQTHSIGQLNQGIHDEMTRQTDAIKRSSQEIHTDLVNQTDMIGKSYRDIHAGITDQTDAIVRFGQELRSDFDRFAAKISELGSKQLIEALNEVIRDFNSKLTEQFGDNFRHLNDAVGKLVAWQDEYKDQMAEMKDGLNAAVQALTDSRDALSMVRAEAEAIPALMERFGGIIATAQQQLENLEMHLQAFADVRDKAVEALPEIDGHLNTVLESINDSVESAAKHYEQLLTDSGSFIEHFGKTLESHLETFKEESTNWLDLVTASLKDGAHQLNEAGESASASLVKAGETMVRSSGEMHHAINESLEDLKKNMAEIGESIASNSDDVRRNLQQSVEDIEKSLQSHTGNIDTFITDAGDRLSALTENAFNAQLKEVQQLGKALEKEIETAMAQRGEALNSEMKAFDDAMQEEVTRLMQLMGNSLASITEKFVEDYRGLTHSMKTVVDQYNELRN